MFRILAFDFSTQQIIRSFSFFISLVHASSADCCALAGRKHRHNDAGVHLVSG